MKTIKTTGRGVKRIALFSLLIFSTLAAQANTVGQEFDHMLHNPENLIMVYVVGGVFFLCFMLYLIGRYFTHKDDQKRHIQRPSSPKLSRARVIKRTS